MPKNDKAARRKAKKKAKAKAAVARQQGENRELKKHKQDAALLHPTRPIPVIVAELDRLLLDVRGNLRVLESAVYDDIDHTDLRVWCNRRAIYGLPTHELTEWLREFIGGRSAIEVGSGNGVLGRALGIPRTDSRIQEQVGVQLSYALQGQPTITYGSDVEKLEALEAVRHYQPQVVVGCWVTNWTDPHKPFSAGGGSMYGLHEGRILAHPGLEAYVVVGNEAIHNRKPIMKLPHETIKAPWIRSRATDPTGNAIFVWRTPGSISVPSA